MKLGHKMTGIALTLALATSQSFADCRPLFDEETLNDWQVLGDAVYEIRDGTLVGRAVDVEANSFLRTNEEFDDFDLTLEFKFDAGMFNSGVQFRSSIYEKPTTVNYRARGNRVIEVDVSVGSVYGYQAEIDPSERAWTAEIHDEAARGWVETYSKQPVAKMIQPDTWHTMRIRAGGDHIQTWLDGVQIVNMEDDARDSGFIALQVHGIRDASEIGKEILFRDIELCTL